MSMIIILLLKFEKILLLIYKANEKRAFSQKPYLSPLSRSPKIINCFSKWKREKEERHIVIDELEEALYVL